MMSPKKVGLTCINETNIIILSYPIKKIFEVCMVHITPNWIDNLADNEIFVFGSNLAGQHSGGAARLALKWGAVMGQGVGIQGKTYAIPTMFSNTADIKPYVDEFINYAKVNPEMVFLVTEIGCGIAGFTPKNIAPLFKQVAVEQIDNISLPKRFMDELSHLS